MTSDATPVPDETAGSGAAWFDPGQRLPRRGQFVRVVTKLAVDHQATFQVAFTDDWPAGASWELPSGQHMAFADIDRWSPDAETPAPPRPGAVVPEPADAEPEPEPERAPGPLPLAAEIGAEIERTKAVLGLLPQTLMDWSPHPAIPTLSTLALRTVRIAARIGWMLDLDELERSFEPDLPPFETVDQIVVSYGANADEVAELLDGLTEARLTEPWRLVRNGDLVAEMPRGYALRWYGLTPLIHHRAEIALMLRALGFDPPHLYPEWAFVDEVAAETWEVPGGEAAGPTP